MYELTSFKPGDRVQLHPATDRWMRGDRFATVYRVGVKRVFLKMDKSGKRVAYAPRDIIEIL